MPKIYFASKMVRNQRRYEAIDGQQRLRAIQDFFGGKRILSPESAGRAAGPHKLTVDDLTSTELSTFNSYKVTVSITEQASPEYKRVLFTRLQLGEHLNPAELRNALESSAPRQFRSFAINNPFFDKAGIKDKRFMRDDYLTHIFGYLYFKNQADWKDIKAPSLKLFVLARSVGVSASHLHLATRVLEFMESIVSIRKAKTLFRNKWTFFDSFLFLAEHHDTLLELDAASIGLQLCRVEALRKQYYRTSETLLAKTCRVSHKEELFHYIHAYKAGGAIRQNIEVRSNYLKLAISL